MSATTGIAIMAAANSAAATEAANQARHAACTMLIQNYQPKGATVDAMRQYASCVNFIYPETTNIAGMQLAALALIVAFIGCFSFGVYQALDEGEGWLSIVRGFVYGTLCASAVLLIECAIYGVSSLFN